MWMFRNQFSTVSTSEHKLSYCPPAETDLSSSKKLVVVVYNSLGWKRSDVIRFPVVSEIIAVYDSNGKEVEYQLLPIVNDAIALRNYYTSAYTGKSPSSTPKYSLAFTTSVTPLGFTTYVISQQHLSTFE